MMNMAQLLEVLTRADARPAEAVVLILIHHGHENGCTVLFLPA
jgi:hypothetical protein